MKRVSQNSHIQYNRAKLKHQNLLLEFLDLQKEYVSKKKKLQAMNQKRDTLLAEVRFLRQRYNYLSVIKSQESGQRGNSPQSNTTYLQSRMNKNYSINEAVEREQCSLPDFDPNAVHEEGNVSNLVDVKAPSRKEKKHSKNGLVNGKRIGKKKISWQDQVALKV